MFCGIVVTIYRNTDIHIKIIILNKAQSYNYILKFLIKNVSCKKKDKHSNQNHQAVCELFMESH